MPLCYRTRCCVIEPGTGWFGVYNFPVSVLTFVLTLEWNTHETIDFIRWWLEPELNRRHKDFQSSALPTELSSHNADAYIENLFRPFRKRQFANFEFPDRFPQPQRFRRTTISETA